jgi:hypothetical protein
MSPAAHTLSPTNGERRTVKTCSTCRRSLSYSEFNLRTRSSDGRQSVCRECNAARARRYYADNLEKHRRAVAAQVAKTRARHLERIAEYLLAHPCVDCGETDVRVLDFDHRDGAEKTAEVMKLAKAAYSWQRVSAEIAKCDVRCRNCHAIITYERMGANWRSTVVHRERPSSDRRTAGRETGTVIPPTAEPGADAGSAGYRGPR